MVALTSPVQARVTPAQASTRVPTPLGTLLLLASPLGLTRVVLPNQNLGPFISAASGDPAPEDPAPEDPAPEDPAAAPHLEVACVQLDEYFSGRRHSFSIPLDLPPSSWRASVQLLLSTVPYGSTLSYAALAQRAGRPRAVRAAASACAANPLPLFLPCHRVVRSNGTSGLYAGGAPAKTLLLSLEADASFAL